MTKLTSFYHQERERDKWTSGLDETYIDRNDDKTNKKNK